MSKYLVIDNSDAYHAYTSLFETEAKMLESIQDKDIELIAVYEVSRKLNIVKRPSVVLADED